MRTLLRFLKPYWLQTFGVLAALGLNLAGVLLVPTILANMINVGVSARDFDYILGQGLFMLAAAFVYFPFAWLPLGLFYLITRRMPYDFL